jgi:hypothetical protein
LEQGRDNHPSAHVLDALARALQLDEDATAHLRSLSQPAAARFRTEEPERAPDSVRRLIGSWLHTPAFVQGRHMDVLAANALASAVSPVFSPGVKIVQATFLDPEVRRLVGDAAWDTIAHHADPGSPSERALSILAGMADRTRDVRRRDCPSQS